MCNTSSQHLSNTSFGEKPADARRTRQLMVPPMVVTAVGARVGEAEEALQVAWEGGGDMKKQSLEQPEELLKPPTCS